MKLWGAFHCQVQEQYTMVVWFNTTIFYSVSKVQPVQSLRVQPWLLIVNSTHFLSHVFSEQYNNGSKCRGVSLLLS